MTTSADQYRAEFDAVVSFSNGGGLQAQGFRVDVPGPDVTEEQVAILFVTSLGLLTTERVEVQRLRLLAEPHKGTRGGPSEQHAARTRTTRRLIELSHVIEAGMVTYPGLPGPAITPHLTAHTVLLSAGIPVVEHLTGLARLRPHGARFSAAPPRVASFGTFPVRAFAIVATAEHGRA